MAITSLAERKSYSAVTGCDEGVGPGSYMGHKVYEHNPSCAPFTSTSARIPDRSISAGPDAGTYTPQLPPKQKQFPGLGVPFGVSGARLGTRPRPPGPGPAGYNVAAPVEPDVEYGHRTMGRAPEDPRSDFIRKARYSKPSIPKPSQAYGYGETAGGVLVKQEPPQQVVSGIGSDRIGSNHYTLSDGVTKTGPKNIRGGKFGGGVRKALSNLQDVPGPGHYQATTNLKQRHTTPGAAFKSGTQRGFRSGDEEEPGPGAYSVASSSSSSSSSFQRGDYQFFGSTSRRFKPAAKETKPGPGAYSSFPGSISEEATRSASCFARDGERWKSHTSRFERKPGPGTYNAANTDGFFGWQNPDAMSTVSRSFSLLSNQGSFAFGATSRRFRYGEGKPKPSAEQMARGELPPEEPAGDSRDQKPGPGAYDLPSSFKRGGRTSAAFQKPLRKSEKFGGSNEPRPSPGAYSPRLPGQIGRVARVPPRGEGFLGSMDRFKQLKGDQKPGPGSYTLDNRPPNELKCPFSCSQDRFSNLGKSQGPGPGAYRRDVDWGGKSFNILFSREV
ncbi:unnamed protein product [Amoebophrya sp. A120]|nr:unnamed protein product [Amoebophrya sp. A120]|eukprot:GSA120T00019085001.1